MILSLKAWAFCSYQTECFEGNPTRYTHSNFPELQCLRALYNLWNHHSNSQPHQQVIPDQTMSVLTCTYAVQSLFKILIQNPYTKFCPLTYAQTLGRVPFSGSSSVNSKCLRSSEYQSYSLQPDETFMLCLGSTCMLQQQGTSKQKSQTMVISRVSFISRITILYYFTHQFQTTCLLFYSILQFFILREDAKGKAVQQSVTALQISF